MSLGFMLTTALEILAGGFIIWGFFHEDKFVELEDKIWRSIKSRRHRKEFVSIKGTSSPGHHNKSCI